VRTKILWQRSQEPNLHFRKLRDRDKLLLLEEIATADLRAIAVMIHKPSITNRSAFNQKNVLYHYAARYLLERVSWCCRDWAANGVNGDGTAEVHFSNRANLKMQEFQSYLERLRFQSDNRIDWSIIKPDQCQILMPKRDLGQQIADAVASAFFFSVRSLHGNVPQPDYAQALHQVIYKAGTKYDGLGIKIWPREYHQRLSQTIHWDWLRKIYKFEE